MAPQRETPLPTSRIHRLFRPFLSKLASVQSLFPNPSTSSSFDPNANNGVPDSPCLPAPKIVSKPRRTYSRLNANASASSYAHGASSFSLTSASSRADVTSGSATGLPLFELDRKMKRAKPRGIPAELGRIPLPVGARMAKGIDKLRGVEVGRGEVQFKGGMDMGELSKRTDAFLHSFRHILELAYPSPTSSGNMSSPTPPPLLPPLGIICARRVGENMEAWIEDQIIEEFDEEEEGGDVGGKREGRKLELREDWWEGVPERWRRYAVTVHAISLVLNSSTPCHGLFESMLDICLSFNAIYEASLLLPHTLLLAYTLTPSAPGPSYLPTIARKLSLASDAPFAFKWQRVVSSSLAQVLTYLDSQLAGDGEDRSEMERRWLGDTVDGLIRDGEEEHEASAHLLLGVFATLLEASGADHQPLSDLFIRRIWSWTQHTIFNANHLQLHGSSPSILASINVALADLSILLHSHLSIENKVLVSNALLALDMHLLTTSLPSVESSPSSSFASAETVVPSRIPTDSLKNISMPHILTSHSTLSTVLSLSTALRLHDLPTLESSVLSTAISQFDRLSPFSRHPPSSSSRDSSPSAEPISEDDAAEDALAAQAFLSELSTLLEEAEKRRCEKTIASRTEGDSGMARGSKPAVAAMRFEELVGGWVEVTPVVKKRRRRMPGAESDECTSEEEEGGEFDGSPYVYRPVASRLAFEVKADKTKLTASRSTSPSSSHFNEDDGDLSDDPMDSLGPDEAAFAVLSQVPRHHLIAAPSLPPVKKSYSTSDLSGKPRRPRSPSPPVKKKVRSSAPSTNKAATTSGGRSSSPSPPPPSFEQTAAPKQPLTIKRAHFSLPSSQNIRSSSSSPKDQKKKSTTEFPTRYLPVAKSKPKPKATLPRSNSAPSFVAIGSPMRSKPRRSSILPSSLSISSFSPLRPSPLLASTTTPQRPSRSKPSRPFKLSTTTAPSSSSTASPRSTVPSSNTHSTPAQQYRQPFRPVATTILNSPSAVSEASSDDMDLFGFDSPVVVKPKLAVLVPVPVSKGKGPNGKGKTKAGGLRESLGRQSVGDGFGRRPGTALDPVSNPTNLQ